MSTKKFLDLDGLSRVWNKVTGKFALKSLYGDTTINVGRKSNTTTGTNSAAEGYNTTASGNYSHAEGSYTTASGNSAHAEGNYATASSSYAHAEGYQTNASGSSSHVEGSNTVASANYTHAEGNYTLANGNCAHAEGGNNSAVSIKVTGDADATTYTVADTTNVKVGNYLRVGSVVSKVTGVVANTSITVTPTLSSTALTNATAYVMLSVASGAASHSEGNKTLSSGTASHAEGYETTASGYYSHSEGLGTVAQRKSQHVIGEYNVYDMTGGQATHGKYLSIAGNGADASNRSNAQTLDWDGNGWYKGNIKVGGTSYTDTNAKELATKDYVESLVVDGATKTFLYDGKASGNAITSDTTYQLPQSIYNFDMIVVGFNVQIATNLRAMELTQVVYPHTDTITYCDSTGTGATGAYQVMNSNTNFTSTGNAYRIMWGFTDATHIRNILGTPVNSWTNPGICYVIGYKFSALPDGYMEEPSSEGTNGQVLTTDGNGGRTWTTVSGGGGVGEDLTGQTVAPTSSTTTTAGTRAEIFNDYRTRTYISTTATAGNVASGDYAHAEGSATTATGDNAHAEGSGTVAGNNSAHAEGMQTKADVSYAHAEGYQTTAHSQAAHSEGTGTYAGGKSQHVEGEYNKTDPNAGTVLRGTYLHIAGNGTANNSRSNAHTLDWSGNAWFAGDVYVGSTSGTDKDAGSKKLATEDRLIGQNVAGNQYVIDEETYTAGTGAEMFNDYRTRGTMIDQKYQMELKTGNITIGAYAHAEGMGNNVIGDYSHAEGCNTTSNGGYGSHSEGLQTQANGEGSHAEGEGTQANAADSHAEGISAQANANFAHAEGNDTRANGESSHAEGFSCTADDFASHAEGESTYTYAAASHVEGKHTIASCIGQHVEGQYNIEDENGDYAHIVGNGYWDEEANEGEGEEVRSNAHTLDWSGNAWYKGTIKIGGTSYANGNEVATQGYVDDKITYGTSDLTAGTSQLTTGTLYFVYE